MRSAESPSVVSHDIGRDVDVTNNGASARWSPKCEGNDVGGTAVPKVAAVESADLTIRHE
jgi:hypothetical protein